MPIATMTSKGQITIPREIRDALNLRPGDRLDFVRRPDGVVELRPMNRRLIDLMGMLHAPGRHATLEEMDEAIRRHLAEEDRRTRP